jgi:hypothetical protein
VVRVTSNMAIMPLRNTILCFPCIVYAPFEWWDSSTIIIENETRFVKGLRLLPDRRKVVLFLFMEFLVLLFSGINTHLLRVAMGAEQ